jgi:hypothetical protein
MIQFYLIFAAQASLGCCLAMMHALVGFRSKTTFLHVGGEPLGSREGYSAAASPVSQAFDSRHHRSPRKTRSLSFTGKYMCLRYPGESYKRPAKQGLCVGKLGS